MYIAHRMTSPMYDMLRLGQMAGFNSGWAENTRCEIVSLHTVWMTQASGHKICESESPHLPPVWYCHSPHTLHPPPPHSGL